jgi:Protein NO VEIN, C-terminal
LLDGEVDGDGVAELGSEKVIADPRSVLVQPRLLYFEDVPDLASVLRGIAPHIIRRPEGAWRAMRAAGVQDLSRAARPRIVALENRGEAPWLSERLDERQLQLARITSATGQDAWNAIYDRLVDVELVAGDGLEIVWELDAFNHHFSSEPYPTDALWVADEQTLYVAGEEDSVSWEMVGRELARALLPDAEPGPLAFALAAALSARTPEAATRALDNAGYPQLAPEIAAELVTQTVEDLVAVDAEEIYEPPDWEHDELPVEEDDERVEPAEGQEEVEERDLDSAATSDTALGRGFGGGRGDENGTGGTRGRGGDDSREGDSAPPGDLAGGRGRRDGRRRGRLRSYVVVGDGQSEDGERPNDAEDDQVDRAGVDAVLEYERAAGRTPIEKDHYFPGYDIESEFADGEIARYIEVKATDGPWDPFGVPLSSKQFTTAQGLEDQYWLYIVEYARDEDRRRIWTIQDPARRVTEFMFDDGWREAAAAESLTQREPESPSDQVE